MSKKTWTITVIVIVALMSSIAIYTNYKANNIEEVNNERQDAIDETYLRPEITVNTKHQYKDGVHTYIGTFETPTPCDTYNAVIDLNENGHVIEITHEPNEEELCAQVVTERQFRVSFEAEENVDAIATINGELVNLNVFEVPSDQNIEDFEIFIKG
jgi:hypothetical protein